MGKKKLLAIRGLTLIGVLLFFILLPSPVLAISNPNDIAFGCGTNTNMYQVFQDLAEDGDMLFVAETYIHYLSEPTDYTAEQAYLFEVLDTDGTTVLQAIPVQEYEAYVTSIYFDADQVDDLGLVWESAYAVRLTGNPSIFGALVEGTNQVTCTLNDSDYITDSPAGTSAIGLRIFCLDVASDLEAFYDPEYAYTVSVQGTVYLTTTGGNIFLDGIPNLNTFVSNLFQTSTSVIDIESIDGKGAYAETLDYTVKLGDTIGNAITNLGVWWGMGSTMAGVVVLFIIMLVVCGYIYVKTQSPLVPDAIAMALPLLGGYLGLIPLALAFTITLMIAVITLYYFFTRGVL